ncbi:MAG TPA: ATP-dependent zinc metalloprotease FtsH [Bdellovibrionota bacterium]|nr:ATP-dependent zinc metalloprotease FtsH [Bdellovibrionota bacterium]
MPPKKQSKRFKFTFGYLTLGLLALLLFNLFSSPPPGKVVPYSDMKESIRKKEFDQVWLTDQFVVGVLPETAVKSPPAGTEKRIGQWFSDSSRVAAVRPAADQDLIKLLDEVGTKYQVKYENTAFRDFLMTWILPIAAMLFLWGFVLKRMGPGTEVMTFGKNKARLQAEADLKTTFADVAGQDEAKEELKEIIEFLRAPKRFTVLGGKLPKGILLVGPPGTGKTLLGRAVAGEAKVPFFNISGSDFVEMFVGVGAARVRDLFQQAKSKAPCIVFIDELDAVGKARGIGMMGGHDEREQTLNQILVEIDGFDTQAGVIIMAATNRPEILDPALLRAGRFDRHVFVGRPDVKERQAILELHTKNVKKGPDLNLETIAKRTPGLVGADLANVVNEAALLAARVNATQVEMKHFEQAVDRILTGLEKKNRVINRKEKEIVAHHEAGHALVAALGNSTDKVHKITIIPRGIGALGFTLQLPTEDRYLMTREELLQKVDVLLGGRASESIVFQDVSTGAHDDLQRATEIVRSMVTQYGMGKTLGPVTVERERTPLLVAQGEISTGKNFSEETARQIDEEIKAIMAGRLDRVISLLKQNLPLLKEIAQELLEKETLNEEEFHAIVQRHLEKPVSTAV